MNSRSSIFFPIIWALALIITAAILARGIKNRNSNEDTISVVGLGTKDFISDEIFWKGSFSRKSMDAKESYNSLLQDKETVRQFFISKGFKETEFSFEGAEVDKVYRTQTITSENGYQTRTEEIFDGYNATQNVTFSARKNPELMKKIENVSQQMAELINSGIEFNAEAIQYTYTNLPSLKHDLIENATKDARERAEKIVETGKGDLGKMKSASLGVFQISGKGSNEEDTYGGIFDVYSKEKTARITLRLSYILK